MKNISNINDNSLVSLSNSLLAHFGVKPFHQTIKEIDNVLSGHQKVAVVLFDGMGRNIVRKHLKDDSFIRSHYFHTINSTFPPTTTAATTAFLTGKYPIETGWMAWDQYFEEYKRNIILFKNVDYNTKEPLLPKNIAYTLLPTKTILQLVNENDPSVATFDIKRYPINIDGPKSLQDLEDTINTTLLGVDKCFAYFYFDSPDYEMHENGIDSDIVHRIVNDIDSIMRRVCKANPDTLFITIADHGHINVKYLDLCEHDDLYSLLRLPISFEKRTTNLFVKEDKKDEFKNLFNKYYEGYFVLLSKEEVMEKQMFGEGHINPRAVEFIGDFIATSIKEYGLYASKETDDPELFKGHHAGFTSDEILIDVSIYNR